MTDKWWLVSGVIIETANGNIHKLEMLPTGVIGVFIDGFGVRFDDLINPKLRGVPFDCMPEWVVKIKFGQDRFWMYSEGFSTPCDSIYFHNCPDEWKGETFEVTPELRQLIFGEVE